MMRLGLAAVVVLGFGCAPTDSGGFGPGPTGDGPGPGGNCTATSCGDQVCSRTFVCLPAADVHVVKTTWTMNGAPANAASCAVAPDLQITFTGGGGNWGYAPVPCMEGQFAIDRFPIWFDTVQLGSVNDFGGVTASIDPTTGVAAIDLVY